MSNSFSSRVRRSSAVARRNAANSPCGSSTTLLNCASPIPSTSVTMSPTSSARVVTPRHRPPVCSSSTTAAGALV